MAQTSARIASGGEIMDGEPRIAGRRVTVLYLFERIEGLGEDPQAVADRHDLDVADVYRALAYYHENPREMQAVRERRGERIESARQDAPTPDDVNRDR